MSYILFLNILCYFVSIYVLSGPAAASRTSSHYRICRRAFLFIYVGPSVDSSVLLQHGPGSLTFASHAAGAWFPFPSFPNQKSILPKHQVDRGVPVLCAVLKEANEQRQSKSWYLLRALTLQTCSSYLSLDTAALPQTQRRSITQHGECEPCFLAVLFELFESVELMDCLSGLNSPDTALYEGLKLLCSLLVTIVGKGLYGSNGSSSEMRFIGQGKPIQMWPKIE